MRGAVQAAPLRTVWLLVGAAIGFAAGLLLLGLAQVLGVGAGAALAFLLPVPLIGLLPGVRELEVTAARALLRIAGDLVEPARQRADHRVRTCLLVTAHLGLGLTAAVLLVGLMPGAVTWTAASISGRSVELAAWGLPVVPPVAGIALGLVAVAACLTLTAALGLLAAHVTARLLGPTPKDRLEVALARLAAESEHARLARDLHDGIGHALTIIGVQATAGRRALSADPTATAATLDHIIETTRRALAELDDLLAVLHRGPTARTAEPDLGRLPELIEAHRRSGLDVTAAVEVPPTLPHLVSTTAYRIAAEGLANAERHAGPGPVALQVAVRANELTVTVTSPPAASSQRPGPARAGRGLSGLAERVALFDGSLDAGRAGSGEWVVRAVVPLEVHG